MLTPANPATGGTSSSLVLRVQAPAITQLPTAPSLDGKLPWTHLLSSGSVVDDELAGSSVVPESYTDRLKQTVSASPRPAATKGTEGSIGKRTASARPASIGPRGQEGQRASASGSPAYGNGKGTVLPGSASISKRQRILSAGGARTTAGSPKQWPTTLTPRPEATSLAQTVGSGMPDLGMGSSTVDLARTHPRFSPTARAPASRSVGPEPTQAPSKKQQKQHSDKKDDDGDDSWKLMEDSEVQVAYLPTTVERHINDPFSVKPKATRAVLDPLRHFFANGGWETLNMAGARELSATELLEVEELMETVPELKERMTTEEWEDETQTHCSHQILDALRELDDAWWVIDDDSLVQQRKRETTEENDDFPEDAEFGAICHAVRYGSNLSEINDICTLPPAPKLRRKVVKLYGEDGEISDYSDIDELEEEARQRKKAEQKRRETMATEAVEAVSSEQTAATAWKKLGFLLKVGGALKPKSTAKDLLQSATSQKKRKGRGVSEYHSYFNKKQTKLSALRKQAAHKEEMDDEEEKAALATYLRLKHYTRRRSEGHEGHGIPLRPKPESIDDAVSEVRRRRRSSVAATPGPSSGRSSPTPSSIDAMDATRQRVTLNTITVQSTDGSPSNVQIELDVEQSIFDEFPNHHLALANANTVMMFVKNNGKRRAIVLIETKASNNVKLSVIKGQAPTRTTLMIEVSVGERLGVALLQKFDRNRKADRIVTGKVVSSIEATDLRIMAAALAETIKGSSAVQNQLESALTTKQQRSEKLAPGKDTPLGSSGLPRSPMTTPLSTPRGQPLQPPPEGEEGGSRRGSGLDWAMPAEVPPPDDGTTAGTGKRGKQPQRPGKSPRSVTSSTLDAKTPRSAGSSLMPTSGAESPQAPRSAGASRSPLEGPLSPFILDHRRLSSASEGSAAPPSPMNRSLGAVPASYEERKELARRASAVILTRYNEETRRRSLLFGEDRVEVTVDRSGASPSPSPEGRKKRPTRRGKAGGRSYSRTSSMASTRSTGSTRSKEGDKIASPPDEDEEHRPEEAPPQEGEKEESPLSPQGSHRQRGAMTRYKGEKVSMKAAPGGRGAKKPAKVLKHVEEKQQAGGQEAKEDTTVVEGGVLAGGKRQMTIQLDPRYRSKVDVSSSPEAEKQQATAGETPAGATAPTPPRRPPRAAKPPAPPKSTSGGLEAAPKEVFVISVTDTTTGPQRGVVSKEEDEEEYDDGWTPFDEKKAEEVDRHEKQLQQRAVFGEEAQKGSPTDALVQLSENKEEWGAEGEEPAAEGEEEDFWPGISQRRVSDGDQGKAKRDEEQIPRREGGGDEFTVSEKEGERARSKRKKPTGGGGSAPFSSTSGERFGGIKRKVSGRIVQYSKSSASPDARSKAAEEARRSAATLGRLVGRLASISEEPAQGPPGTPAASAEAEKRRPQAAGTTAEATAKHRTAAVDQQGKLLPSTTTGKEERLTPRADLPHLPLGDQQQHVRDAGLRRGERVVGPTGRGREGEGEREGEEAEGTGEFLAASKKEFEVSPEHYLDSTQPLFDAVANALQEEITGTPTPLAVSLGGADQQIADEEEEEQKGVALLAPPLVGERKTVRIVSPHPPLPAGASPPLLIGGQVITTTPKDLPLEGKSPLHSALALRSRTGGVVIVDDAEGQVGQQVAFTMSPAEIREAEELLRYQRELTARLEPLLAQLRTTQRDSTTLIRQSLVIATWNVQRLREINLGKLLNLLDRRVGRKHGWLQAYQDDDVYLSLFGGDREELVTRGFGSPYHRPFGGVVLGVGGLRFKPPPHGLWQAVGKPTPPPDPSLFGSLRLDLVSHEEESSPRQPRPPLSARQRYRATHFKRK